MTAPASTPARSRGLVLILDDEAAMGNILVKSLALDGIEAVAFTDPATGLAAIPKHQPDLILTDVRMPGLTGQEVLRRISEEYPDIPVLIMTAYGTIEDAVNTLKAGAFNYITKPFQHENLLHQIQLALQHRHLKQENSRLLEESLAQLESRRMIGESEALHRVRAIVARAAKTDSAVLITGESGAGKELVAREIHRQSPRRSKRFVAVNCPAIPPTLIESELFGFERGAFTGADKPKMGLIELSAGGTLFLDEIGEIPVELQVKLLRVLQEREIQRLGGLRPIPVDIRVIAATNRDLDKEIEAGRFRIDLFYRINVIPIRVPALRERPEDIPEIADFFLERIARRSNHPGLRLEPAVAEALAAQPWPGNIRELENTLERMAVLCTGTEIKMADLPPEMLKIHAGSPPRPYSPDDTVPDPLHPWPESYKEARDEFERGYLERLLRACDGNITAAAQISGISRRSLYERIEKLGFDRKLTE